MLLSSIDFKFIDSAISSKFLCLFFRLMSTLSIAVAFLSLFTNWILICISLNLWFIVSRSSCFFWSSACISAVFVTSSSTITAPWISPAVSCIGIWDIFVRCVLPCRSLIEMDFTVTDTPSVRHCLIPSATRSFFIILILKIFVPCAFIAFMPKRSSAFLLSITILFPLSVMMIGEELCSFIVWT